MDGIRINKFLSEAGICSRRKADQEIEDGKVLINGVTAKSGDRVLPGDEVRYMGKVISKEEQKILLIYNKPVGVVCTEEEREKDNLYNHFSYPVRVTYIGRLDRESEGLLLLTNEGDLVNKINRARNNHQKEYIVTVNKPVTDSFLHGMANGVPLVELGRATLPCEVKRLGKKQFSIILTQGLNRQIRRMCEYFDYRVVALKRVRVMNLTLGDLKPGEYREVTKKEREELNRLLGDSVNEGYNHGR